MIYRVHIDSYPYYGLRLSVRAFMQLFTLPRDLKQKRLLINVSVEQQAYVIERVVNVTFSVMYVMEAVMIRMITTICKRSNVNIRLYCRSQKSFWQQKTTNEMLPHRHRQRVCNTLFDCVGILSWKINRLVLILAVYRLETGIGAPLCDQAARVYWGSFSWNTT